MVDKKFIIAEIKRLANENGGVAPGIKTFEQATSITVAKWRGRYWVKWSDALLEAGLKPNSLNQPTDEDFLLRSLAELTAKLDQFPTYAHIRLEKRNNPDFPSYQAFSRLGSTQDRVELIRKFATDNNEFSGILSLLPAASVDIPVNTLSTAKEGFVYLGLLKVGTQKRYKIGKTNLVERRSTELSLQLPEKLELVHSIKTDDMTGIEKYWHKRFADKNTNGEWFNLSADDIRAFKLRKFM